MEPLARSKTVQMDLFGRPAAVQDDSWLEEPASKRAKKVKKEPKEQKAPKLAKEVYQKRAPRGAAAAKTNTAPEEPAAAKTTKAPEEQAEIISDTGGADTFARTISSRPCIDLDGSDDEPLKRPETPAKQSAHPYTGASVYGPGRSLSSDLSEVMDGFSPLNTRMGDFGPDAREQVV